MKRRPDIVSASEIGSWVYCPEAWRLQALGAEPENWDALEAGERRHAETAAFEVQSGAALTLGRWLIAAAVLLFIVLAVLLVRGR
jgi:hypothetical protein